ncbi:MAG: hypothetical protein ACYC2Y_05565 [Armatimonadota bacterium]
MKRLICSALLLLLAVPAFSAEAPWDDMLSKVGLTPETAQLAAGRWRGGGTYSLFTFNALWDDWRLIDGTAIGLAKDFRASAGSFEKLGLVAARSIDVKSTGEIVPAHKGLSGGDALANAIEGVCRFGGSSLTAEEKLVLETRAKFVPKDVAEAAAEILWAVPTAAGKRNTAIPQDEAFDFVVNFTLDDTLLQQIDAADMNSIVDGGLTMARAVDAAARKLKNAKGGNLMFTWKTPLGEIALMGGRDNIYPPGDYLLVIDTGGNDFYHTAGATGENVPLSVVLDLAGNDRYESGKTGAIGTGCLGYSFILDSEGDDIYKTEVAGPASGFFGVGMLIDRAGNDTYDNRMMGQATAMFGIGVLCDLGGDDKYLCFTQAQGYGSTKGCGALIDCGGNDLYEANDSQIDYPSPQTAAHNTSLAQGCGFGRRAHPGDGHSMAGGVGILVDGAGNDTYRAGVFGQGVSYWYCLGFLVDMAGDDSYNGVWYNQGACAHYAVAAMCDLAGNDRYCESMNQTQGHARDYSIGWLHDLSGDDDYIVAGLGLGEGNINSIGVFLDDAGNDKYDAQPGGCFGNATQQAGALCLGLFYDGGGENTFPAERVAPKSTWVQNDSEGLGVGRAD